MIGIHPRRRVPRQPDEAALFERSEDALLLAFGFLEHCIHLPISTQTRAKGFTQTSFCYAPGTKNRTATKAHAAINAAIHVRPQHRVPRWGRGTPRPLFASVSKPPGHLTSKAWNALGATIRSQSGSAPGRPPRRRRHPGSAYP